MAKEYETFTDNLSSLREGEEIELIIRDQETYEPMVVKAIVFSSSDKVPEGDTLWIRSTRGVLITKEPWVIKITKRVGDVIERQTGQSC